MKKLFDKKRGFVKINGRREKIRYCPNPRCLKRLHPQTKTCRCGTTISKGSSSKKNIFPFFLLIIAISLALLNYQKKQHQSQVKQQREAREAKEAREVRFEKIIKNLPKKMEKTNSSSPPFKNQNKKPPFQKNIYQKKPIKSLFSSKNIDYFKKENQRLKAQLSKQIWEKKQLKNLLRRRKKIYSTPKKQLFTGKKNPAREVKALEQMMKFVHQYKNEDTYFQHLVYRVNQMVTTSEVRNRLFFYLESKHLRQRLLAIEALGNYPLHNVDLVILNQIRAKLLRYVQKIFPFQKENLFKYQRELETLTWALARLKSRSSKNLLRKIRWKFGVYSNFWNRTATPYNWIPSDSFKAIQSLTTSESLFLEALKSLERNRALLASKLIWLAYKIAVKEPISLKKAEQVLKCGILYHLMNKLNQADKYYNEAIFYNPNFLKIYFYRAMLFLQKKKYSRALKECTFRIQKGDPSKEIYLTRGNAYFALGYLVKGTEDYKKYLYLSSFPYRERILKIYIQKYSKK